MSSALMALTLFRCPVEKCLREGWAWPWTRPYAMPLKTSTHNCKLFLRHETGFSFFTDLITSSLSMNRNEEDVSSGEIYLFPASLLLLFVGSEALTFTKERMESNTFYSSLNNSLFERKPNKSGRPRLVSRIREEDAFLRQFLAYTLHLVFSSDAFPFFH